MLTFEKICSIIGMDDARRYTSLGERRGYLSYIETLEFKQIENRIKKCLY